MWFLRQRAVAVLAFAVWACIMVLPVRADAALPLAMTKENVQKKAVIIRGDAKLFSAASGEEGKKAEFMQIFFLLDGESSGRAPVTYAPNKTDPDGWIERSSFIEWNTLQMINFEPQSGRELARVFNDAGCAESFGRTGLVGDSCQELGSEPQRMGKHAADYSLLVPVMQREGDNYLGGFVRVTVEAGGIVKPLADEERGTETMTGQSPLGYDLVLVVDSTAGMDLWFRPTAEVLDTFVSSVKQQIGTGDDKIPFRVGLLFYRDRKAVPDCDIGFLFRWESELTDNVSAVSQALARAKDAGPCGSDETAEAVYDALSRAIQDSKWKDGHFKVVLLVGDAPPHPPTNKDKNPLGLDVADITKMSEERNVRILSFKIGLDEAAEFESLALGAKENVQGRFCAIESDSVAYKRALLEALNEEWNLLRAANQAVSAGITGQQAQADLEIFERQGIDVSRYNIPVIVANLLPGSSGARAPELIQGWVPRRIKQKPAFGEYVFLSRGTLLRLVNMIELIGLAAEEGITGDGESFLTSLRISLATMLNVQSDDLFEPGESLESIMRKAEILPFKTTVFSFTAEEVNAWRPSDFERFNKILIEKATKLRAYAQNPSNTRFFGDKPHVYVPRDLFP